jgi:hypothetical protein
MTREWFHQVGVTFADYGQSHLLTGMRWTSQSSTFLPTEMIHCNICATGIRLRDCWFGWPCPPHPAIKLGPAQVMVDKRHKQIINHMGVSTIFDARLKTRQPKYDSWAIFAWNCFVACFVAQRDVSEDWCDTLNFWYDVWESRREQDDA